MGPRHHCQVESDYAPLYDSEPGLGLTVWSPLASGILTGKYGGGGGGTAAPAGSRLSMEEHKVSAADVCGRGCCG